MAPGDIDESQRSDVQPQRTLRNRDTAQTGYRPRPLLTSSAKGLAKHELRLQREREANEEFAKANFELKNIKKPKSRQGSSSQHSALNSSQSAVPSEPEQTFSRDHVGEDRVNTSQNDSQESSYLTPNGGSKAASDVNVEINTEKPFLAAEESIHSSAPKRNAQEMESTIVTEIEEILQETTSKEVDVIQEVIDLLPPAKKRNVGNATDEVEDSGYWDDEIDMDWDELDRLDPPIDSISSQCAPLPNLKESESVFRWANNKNVALSTKAADAVSRLRQFIEEEESEKDNSIGEPSSRPAPPKTPLHPTAASKLNKQITIAPEHAHTSTSIDVGLPQTHQMNAMPFSTQTFTSQSSTPICTVNGASQGGQMPLLRMAAPNSTPRKREICYGALPGSSQKKRPSFETPLSRKVMGNTPRRMGSTLPRFKSPMRKNSAQIVTHATQTISSSQNHSQQNRPLSQTCSTIKRAEKQIAKVCVFDVENSTSSRKTLAEVVSSSKWSWQCRDSFKKSEDFEIITTILSDPPSANFFQFTNFSDSGSDAMFGTSSAHQQLAKAAGCELDQISSTWVKNHYSLILWKLAALSYRSEEFEDLFCWEEVMRQLKYRYEREVNRAHRSALKQIQERDAAAGLPMVLCVYDASHGTDDEEPQLTLTDGWYLIRARIDPTLARAVNAGRIKRGRKLAIMGARLDPECSACDPIEGFERSPLMIRGNGCKLARWDTRLGLQKAPFVASIRSLSAEGGVVSMVDVVVIRVYPKGYMGESMFHSNENSSDGTKKDEQTTPDTWTEAEEEEQHNAWLDKRKAITDDIYRSLRSQSHKLMLVTEMLSEACQGLQSESIIDGINPSQCEDYLNAMIQSTNPSSYLTNSGILSAVYQLAQGRLDILMGEEKDELQRQLEEKCPTRNVRSFQVVRVIDTIKYLAKTPSKVKNEFPPNNQEDLSNHKIVKCQRECLLRIWDIEKRQVELLDDHRYLITNLSPSRPNSWPKDVDGFDDIHLNTRMETMFKEIPLR